jgi:CRP-like cAMP-binding protein
MDAFLEKLSPTTHQQLIPLGQAYGFLPGQVLYQQGQPPSGLFMIQQGQVKLFRQSKDKQQILALLGAGGICGAESLPNGDRNPCSAQALTSGNAVYFPPDPLLNLMHTCPDLALIMLERLATQLHQFTVLVHSLAFRDVSARLAELLLKQAENIPPTPEGIPVPRLLSQQEWAAWVGTAREVISRTLKKFEAEGILRLTPEAIIIVNLDYLQDVARQENR